jgi:hypothetical protein
MGYVQSLTLFDKNYKSHENYALVMKLLKDVVEHEKENIMASDYFDSIDVCDKWVYFDGYESFLFPIEGNSLDTFTKTGRDTMDTAVVACHEIIVRLLGGEFYSDGSQYVNQDGMDLANFLLSPYSERFVQEETKF